MKNIILDGENLTISQIAELVSKPAIGVLVDKKALGKIVAAHQFTLKSAGSEPVYGVNTGFGPMASHVLGKEQLIYLQENLIRSHSTGMGKPLDAEFSLAAMVVRLNTLVKGYSGVSPELVIALQTFINKRILPVIFEHGAVGTSGDLIQLSHIALALMGEGEVWHEGKIQPTSKVLKSLKISPYQLKIKEGLSLINGTSCMAGVSALVCVRSENLLDIAVHAGALSLEIVQGFEDSISDKLQNVRPHPGQMEVARRIRKILAASKLLRKRATYYKGVSSKEDIHILPESVQEVYSLRCIPQILGPVWDTLENFKKTVTIEINSATDNPIVDLDAKLFLHGGNFHGDYIAAGADQFKMTLVKLMILSERRTNFFLNRNINKFFPPFMNLKKPGLTLGLQGLQFVATSTTAQSQTLAFPQYVHSISTNGDNQDVVSMGMDAILITEKVLENAYVVSVIELVTLAQAVDFLNIEKKLSPSTHKLYKKVRSAIPKIVDDRVINKELEKLVNKLKEKNV